MITSLNPLFILIPMYIATPALLIVLCQKFRFLDKAGVVVLSFGLGIVLATSGLLPNATEVKSFQENLSGVSVALALSLLVFSMDILAALRTSANTLKSLGLALLSVILVSMLAA